MRLPKIKWYNVFGFDTETDNDGSEAWVCQWCVHDGTTAWIGRDIGDFKNTIVSLTWERKCIVLYAHNLKYDINFCRSLIHELETEGWQSKIIMRKGSPIKVRLVNNERMIEFRDSMKKMPGSLKQLGAMIGLPKLESPRGFYQGWSNDIDYSYSSPDWNYIKRDAEIVAVAMRQLHKGNADGMRFDRATLSGDAWNIAKDMIGTSDGKHHSDRDNWKWDKYFPRLPVHLDQVIRKAYFGGINLSPVHNHGILQGSEERPIYHEDIHNSYGAVMLYKPLPIGMPSVTHEWPTDGILYIAEVRIKLHLRPQYHGNGWYQFKNGIDNVIEGWEHGTIVEDTEEWHELSLTSIDLALLEDWYDVEYDEWYKPTFYCFNDRTGILRPYIDYFTVIKESSIKNGLEYTHAKRMINSFYGRTGLAPETALTTLEWSDDLDDYDWCTEYTLEEDHDAYIPYATFCTAWARKTLLDNVRACLDAIPDSVIHSDTDSVIHYGPPVESIPHGEHLGTWGIESVPPVIIESGFKRYVELKRYPPQSMDDFLGMAMAGVPQQRDNSGLPIGMWIEILDEPTIILTDGYELGQEHYTIRSAWLRDWYIREGHDPDDVDTRKLIPVKVKGGIILEPRTHKLNDNLQWRLRR